VGLIKSENRKIGKGKGKVVSTQAEAMKIQAMSPGSGLRSSLKGGGMKVLSLLRRLGNTRANELAKWQPQR